MRLREPLAAWQARASPRERWLVGTALALVLAAAGWAWVLDPLQRDLAATGDAARDARAALARAQGQADALAGLARASAPAPAAPGPATERLLAQRGLRAAVTSLQARDARVDLMFEAIDFVALTGFVDAMGREARLFPVEVLLAARTTPGSVRAEIAFARPPAR